MKKLNEIDMFPHSSDQGSDTPRGRASAPTLMYLIELDPSINTCLAGGSLPLDMLNVNQDNTHYLIPIQGANPLEMPQYKHYEETQALPSVSSRDVRTNGKLQSNPPKTGDIDGCADINERPTVYDSKSNISGSEESFEESLATTESPSTGLSEAQPLTASGLERPTRKYVHVADSEPPPRAELSLPAALRLHCGRVTPRKLMPPARFGPVRGVSRDISREEARELIVQAAASSKPVFLLPKGDSFCHIDVSDQEQANWFSLLPLGARAANLWLEQSGGQLFAVSPRRLPPRAPLSLGYGARLARALPAPPAGPVQPDEDERAWCGDCGREMTTRPHHCTAAYGSKQRRRRYRCKYCALPFARVFTLKRHVSLHCKSKTTNTASTADAECSALEAVSLTAPAEDNSAADDERAPADDESTPADDERVPSDDSFHNFSGLDFSTTLFDPDLSSHLCTKDDSLLLGQATHGDNTTCAPDINFSPVDYSKKVAKAASLIKCPHCQLTMSSNMKQRHKRQCAARSVSCACGALFRDHARLARHLRADHAPPPDTPQEDTASSDSSYKCEQCQNTFKRRGMLVNHSWREHGAAPLAPLRRRQRHYPCAACPKLYRTAAKRDTHMRVHHPGCAAPCLAVIESGAVLSAPAACAACPRQYATRAKLLQHVRDKHPLLAPPSKSKLPKKAQNKLSLS